MFRFIVACFPTKLFDLCWGLFVCLLACFGFVVLSDW